MNDPTARVLAVLGSAIALCAGCELAESEDDDVAWSEAVSSEAVSSEAMSSEAMSSEGTGAEPRGSVAPGLTAGGRSVGNGSTSSVAGGGVSAASVSAAGLAAASAAEKGEAETEGAESKGPLLAAEADLGSLLELDPDPTPDPPSGCVCITFPEPEGCAEEQFFCNVDRSCICDTGGRLDTLLVPVSGAAELSPGRRAPDSRTEPAPSPEPAASTQLAARATTGDPTPPEPEIGCICGPGSVSAPASDCHPASWYCNASAVCRCRR